ncbi:hypothetical protein GCM10011490_07130 [Pseudoclavibacter endophyticus]|uniref:Yip1 domain-containing protein n=1 Tax=Pseudoclavibacter endophyticus TaxID=1778590 RepID=A0A6H9WTQ6_9MICO|nr:hypothetical protein [Pseudoclavibacter endophyticus]KAB1649804.1 hypothetical protein F8O04_06120 [Pseudoclavibacter endophyticus]GGA59626.1 hypothetical protein GCM10011490_07130 [Pseudoclavibacter endophyticus]
MSIEVDAGAGAVATGAPSGRQRAVAIAAEIFGPKPREAAIWGAGIGVIFGLPLIFGYFMIHFWAVQLVTAVQFGDETLDTSDDVYGVLFIVAVVVLVFSFVGTVGLTTLVAYVRRTSLSTILFVAFLVSFMPYVLFFQLVIVTG